MMCLMLLYLLCFTLQVRYKIRLAGTRLTTWTEATAVQTDLLPGLVGSSRLTVAPQFCLSVPTQFNVRH